MDQRFSVLLVEDNPADVRLVQEMLSESSSPSFLLDCVGTLAGARVYLAQRTPDAILLDLSLPDISGMDTFRELHTLAPSVATIIVTGLADDRVAIAAVRAGAQDYIVKSAIAPDSLVRCIRYGIERHKNTFKSRLSVGPRAKRPGKILGFMGVKGGMGTSTTALGLATLLVREFDVIAAELQAFFSSFARQLDIEGLLAPPKPRWQNVCGSFPRDCASCWATMMCGTFNVCLL